MFLTFSGITAILPTTMAKLFGASNMAVNYGFLQAALVSTVEFQWLEHLWDNEN